MKKLYTIGMGLSFALLATQGFAQVQKASSEAQTLDRLNTGVNETTSPLKKIDRSLAKDDPETFWSEDFSNGLDGQDDNGAWTTGGDQGALWFQTFPEGATNGYDPSEPLDNPAYNNTLNNLWNGPDQPVIQSETKDNGFMMLDADRYNSTSTVDNPDGEVLENLISSQLISPSIDLSDVTGDVLLTFTEYITQCCGPTYAATAELSTDGGSSWVPYDVFSPYGQGNTKIREDVSINITEALSTADDLSNVKVRFVWGGDAYVYWWFIDDVAISQLPDNDLVIGKTYYNNFDALYPEYLAGTISAPEYYNEFEYDKQPDYLVRPFSFGGIVTNAGAVAQTGVSIHVDATLPDGSTVTDYSVTEPMTMEPGETDTIFAADDVMPEAGMVGDYSFSYRVEGDADDFYPNNNVGLDRSTTVTNDADNNGFAMMQNAENITSGTNYVGGDGPGRDNIWGVSYSFPEAAGQPQYLTHLEVVFYNAPGFAETLLGEVVYFNVREGSVFDEDVETDPNSETTVFFDSDNPLSYSSIEIEHELEEGDVWNTDDTAEPVWFSFELPTPILVDANTMYSGEFRIPPSGGPIVFPTLSLNEENYAAYEYNFSSDPSPSLFRLNPTSLAIRFRTNKTVGVDEVSQENGITLLQNYPNPFTDNTKIQYRLETTSTVAFEVHDLTGKLVFTKDLGTAAAGAANTYQLQRGSLAPGVYTYSIVTPENTLTRKLTVK